MDDKKKSSKSDIEDLVTSAAIGAAVGGVATYAVMKNSCDNCDCGKEKINHKQEYIDHKKAGLCDVHEKRCDTCPHLPKNKNCE